MPISRRKFIQLTSLAGASLLVPAFLKAAVRGANRPIPPANGKILVVLHLSGGNDGLNTIVPVRNDIYYRERPTLALPRNRTLALDSDTGLHPALTGVKALYDEGCVTIVNGVGYPSPDRSHHGSTQIWETAGGSRGGVPTQWTGHLTRSIRYTASAPAPQLKEVAALINAGAPTRVYHLSHSGYDTHVDQAGRQQAVLAVLDVAISLFMADLKAGGRLQDVLLLCQSEFGRRVAENSFGGTDHGTAGPVLLIGGGLQQPGLANPVPSLENLDRGDLRHTVDFRSIYAGVLRNWLGSDDGIVPGGKFRHYDGAF